MEIAPASGAGEVLGHQKSLSLTVIYTLNIYKAAAGASPTYSPLCVYWACPWFSPQLYMIRKKRKKTFCGLRLRNRQDLVTKWGERTGRSLEGGP